MPTIEELYEITPEMILKTYAQLTSVKRTAKVLGVCTRTVRRYLKAYGVSIRRGNVKGVKGKKWGKFPTWLRENRDKVLPRSIVKIAEITGCTKDQVKSYLKRERKRMRDFLRSLPDLKTFEFTLRSTDGRLVSMRYFRKCSIAFDPWSFKVKLIADIDERHRYYFVLSAYDFQDLLSF